MKNKSNKSMKQKNNQEEQKREWKMEHNNEKTTTGDEQKRYILFKKLSTQSIEQFRDLNINDYDLNITETFEEIQSIDNAITPLIYCAFYGRCGLIVGLKDICKVLLKNNKVDVDFETENNKQTPLLTACICGNYQIARLLLLSNAEVNKPNMLNHIPFTVTIFRLVEEPASFENKKICFRIAELLAKNGADVNWIIDKKKGFTLMHYFCHLKIKMNKTQKQLNFDIVKFLLEMGANVDQLTLADQTCEDVIHNHCNKDELLQLIKIYRKKNQNLSKPEPKKIKKIDPNFFKIAVKEND